MAPSTARSTATRRFEIPTRAAELGFAVDLPGDWLVHELPDDSLDFEQPTHLLPLALITAPHSAIVFTVAARPAHAEGSVSDSARYLLYHSGLQPQAQGQGELGSLPALVGQAMQESELGPMCVRYAFAEDGGRLLSLSLMAPEMLASVLQPVWQQVLASFALETPKGPTQAIWPEVTTAEADVPTRPAPLDAEIDALSRHALADDAGSFDPEHPTLQRLRHSGAGLVPRLIADQPAQRCVTLASGAILGLIDVPYGWQAIDDGRRLLVFEPSSQVQLNFSLLPLPAGGVQALLDEIEAQARVDYPAPEFLRLPIGRMHALAVLGIQVGDEALNQVHMLIDGPTSHRVLRARVTLPPERLESACNLAEAMLHSAVFGHAAAAVAQRHLQAA